MRGAPQDVLRRVPIFADLTKGEIEQVARLFKERRFGSGDIVIQEGSGGAAFYIVESGECRCFVGGKERAVFQSGDFFGEIAMFDEGPRTATITATGDLVLWGLTYWDFRPVVEANGVIGWKLLQRMAHLLRDARTS